MEEYPEELRTPPVSLVSLVGCSDLHPAVTKHLHSQQPPIHTLAFPDFSTISLLLSPPDKTGGTAAFKDPLSGVSDSNLNAVSSSSPSSSSGGGILRRDWLLKHRSKVPALVAAFFPALHVSGDPTQWLQVCSDLDSLRSVIRPKNIKLVVVVVQSASNDDISEDRLLALRKRAEIDSKYLLFFNPHIDAELKLSLNRLAATFAELALSYYKEEGKKIKTRIEKKSINSIDLNVRYCFKVAVYAEFRRDWAEALKYYEDAYHILREMVGTSTRLPAIQRLVEIKTVAEQLHFKISTLLLHGGKVIEAVKWFRQHQASYKMVVGSPEVIFLHWEWMSRQFLAFAELLETSSATVQSTSSLGLGSAEGSLTEYEFFPAYYYQYAAHYLMEKKSALELALSMSENARAIDSSAESAVPSVHVGQFARLFEQGDDSTLHPLTDEEYTFFVTAEGKRFQDSFEIIALLKKSYESYANLKLKRMASLCGYQIAKEYLGLADLSNAKQFFDDVASLYRQEGWVTLLWDVLAYLRECVSKLGSMKDFVEYSLEMAALPVSSGTDAQSGPGHPASTLGRENIHKEVFGLVSTDVGQISAERETIFKMSGENPLHLEIDPVSPLRSVFITSVAFHEQIVKPGASSLLTISLLSQLPLAIEIDQLEVQFNQSECNFIIVNAHQPLSATSSRRVENAPSLKLLPNKWLRFTYEIKSEKSGKLECQSVLARLGPHFTICSRAESPASMEEISLWKYENRVDTLPTKDSVLASFGQKAIQVEEPEPQVDLILGTSGPALVGEDFVMPVTVTSKGHAVHSGELKINLVDVKGGGLFSPREAETYSMESHHVELCGITGTDAEDESRFAADKIKKIQQSFGLLSVPFLSEGESWACKLEIKWHRPKPIMLFVSLSYSPQGTEPNFQKVHIHKSLQIEGKTGILIKHQFMLPFSRDQLMLSTIKPVPDSEQMPSLPLNEKSFLVVAAKNCTEIPLKLLSMSVEADDENSGTSCLVQLGDFSDAIGLMPEEEFKKVFTVIPQISSPSLGVGTVHLKWKRGNENDKPTETSVSTKFKLPDVNVELPPLVVSLDSPPYAVLGIPSEYSVKIQNQTHLLQEVKFSLTDAQSFVTSGSHCDTIFVLPKSEYILSYKIVPLASGFQQLPKITVVSVRYSAEFRPPTVASSVFVFPSPPQPKIAEQGQQIDCLVAD